MRKTGIMSIVIGLSMYASASFADSNFQNSCSNLKMAYIRGNAVLEATCLKADGSPNFSSIILVGIANNNGKLTNIGKSPSNFQKSCGNINIEVVNTQKVNITAFCRTQSGSSQNTKISLDGISNKDGNLTY
ncbi:MAG: CVNH domain-containing protein [Gammaproteobacteria bacterium]|nr:CVNH domain-containing protein [Gammaproteobacteria bacterium]MDH5653572.1 CVNH domain-containing protein [Gammaproteobacteria bacterium]